MRFFYGLVVSIIICTATDVWAQDTLWVVQRNKSPVLSYTTKSGETVFSIGRQFAAPPATIANMNHKTYQDGIMAGNKILIPIGKFNYVREEKCQDCAPLYYKVKEDESLYQIGRLMGVSQSSIQEWNDLPLPDVRVDQRLLVGWIKYDPTQNTQQQNLGEKKNISKEQIREKNTINSRSTTSKKPLYIDSLEENISSEFETLYLTETGGRTLAEESGSATFYSLKNKLQAGQYFAMHNSAPKGSYIKVHNPATDRYIYVKVIGTIPRIAKYKNAILVLSSNAIRPLEVRDNKFFCKITFKSI